MSALATTEARLRVVDEMDVARGAEIKRRRLALGIKSLRVFSEETGIDREALGKAEEGTASIGTYERAEAWLTRQEEENGLDDEPTTSAAVRVTLHDVYGIGEVIFDGATSPDEMAAYVRALMAEVRPGSGGRNEGD